MAKLNYHVYDLNITEINSKYLSLVNSPKSRPVTLFFLVDDLFNGNVVKNNIENYPKSFNANDSMGDYYKAKGNRQKAIEYFTKALALKDFQEAKQKLEMLNSGK